MSKKTKIVSPGEIREEITDCKSCAFKNKIVNYINSQIDYKEKQIQMLDVPLERSSDDIREAGRFRVEKNELERVLSVIEIL